MGGEKTEMEKTTNLKHAFILCGFGFRVKISHLICMSKFQIVFSVGCSLPFACHMLLAGL